MRTLAFLVVLLGFLAFANAGGTTGGTGSSSVFLFDQFATPAEAGVLSQQFTDANNLRFLAADDFTVPADQTWQINRVIFAGIFQTVKNASQESGAIWNVRIYTSIVGTHLLITTLEWKKRFLTYLVFCR
jgi:hypothetical protein